MRKFLLALCGAVCAASLGLAVACADKEPNYYELTFPATAGVTYDFGELKSGMLVKEGYTVNFTVSFDEGVEGVDAAQVKVNGEALTKGEDGTYSFTMSADTNITVDGIVVLSRYNVEFEKGQNLITYYDKNDKELTSLSDVAAGETVSFKLDVSVYYKQDKAPTVLAGTEEIAAKDGLYSFSVSSNTTVTVVGLEEDDGFTLRTKKNFPDDYGGAGTAEDPYMISRPVDLYYMSRLIGGFSGEFATAHYKLKNDIDLKGEKLYVIGDGTSAGAFFGGSFDGCGHTISNYHIDDSFVEQEEFNEVFQPYLGLFGLIAPTASNPKAVEIKNLNLRNFTINVPHAAEVKLSFYAGGLAAQVLGGKIENCTAEGEIYATADTSRFGYIGGLIGAQQSNGDGLGNTINSTVENCSTDVYINVQSGNVYAAGGISGWLYSIDEDATASILNSTSKGSISGAMASGGIAGRMTPYSFIGGCYSTGNIGGYNDLTGTAIAEYSNAYAGGIVGFADYSSVISDCFAVGRTSAYAATANGYAGDIAGLLDDTSSVPYVEAYPARAYNSWGKSTGYNALGEKVNSTSEITDDFIKNTLKWKESEWTFGEGYPAVKSPETRNVKLTLNVGGSVQEIVLDGYKTVSELYDGTLEQYLTSSGKRTFGYFFDEALTCKVPFGYVAARDVTLYADYRDYSEVSGKYYLQLEKLGSGAYIELNSNGEYTYRNGALSFNSTYIYDGETILLSACPLFAEREVLEYNDKNEPIYGLVNYCAKATLSGFTLKFVDGATYVGDKTLNAVKEFDNFKYGSYYAGDTQYVFYTDGRLAVGDEVYSYTYKDGVIKVAGKPDMDGHVLGDTVTMGATQLTAYDKFLGTWEKSSTTHEKFIFDGKGGYEYKFFGYKEERQQVVEEVFTSDSGTYTSDGAGGIILASSGATNGFKVGLTADGLLTVNNNVYNEEFYGDNSFVGVWRFNNKSEPVEIQFSGLNGKGYGDAVITYPGKSISRNVFYQVNDNIVEVYLDDMLYAQLTYSKINSTLSGIVYSEAANGYKTGALFCLYDDFSGVWISEIGTINFNGFGAYNVAGTSSYLHTQGLIWVNGESAGNYKLVDFKAEGSFTYDNKTYKISYNPATKAVDLEVEDKTFSAIPFDGWQKDNLVDISGRVYSFNGGGNLPTGGILTVGGKEYVYKLNSGVAVIFDEQNREYTVTPKGECYESTLFQGNLYIQSDMVGEWITPAGALEIRKIGSDMTAHGKYLGNNVVFNYDADAKTLTFTYENKKYVISLLSHGEEFGLSIDCDGAVSTGIKELDSLKGRYVSANGWVELDGFGNNSFTKGTATFNDGTTCAYTVSAKGVAQLSLNGTTIMNPVSAQSETSYEKDGKYFELVKVDVLYNSVAMNGQVSYEFDGMGKVVTGDGNEYAYRTMARNYYTSEIYVLIVIDGKAYSASFDYLNTKYTLTIEEKDIIESNLKGVYAVDASEDTLLYNFDAEAGTVTDGEQTYAFKIESCDEQNMTVTLTLISDDKEYVGTLSYAQSKVVLEMSEKE